VSVRVVVLVQLLAILVLGAVTVARFHVLAEVDERAHYDVVQKLAEDHRIPRPTDIISPQIFAIDRGTWPRPARQDPARVGLGGRSYEAMQPPLYYLLAVPAFSVVADHRDKVFAVRAWDLLLLLAAVALLWVLARRVTGAAAPVAYAVALGVVLWPGVIVRAVTIGNTPLELVMALAFMCALWRERLVVAALLLGGALLTKLTLVFLVPLFLVVLWRRRTFWPVLIPPLVMAPWLVLNVVRYGSPTVNLAGQGGVVGGPSGTGLLDRIGDLPRLNARLVDGVLPQEFRFQYDVWWVRGLMVVLVAALAVAAVAALWRHRRDFRVWFLGLPALSGWAIMNLVYVVNASDQFLLRYLYAALPPLALGVGLVLPRRLATGVAVVATLAAFALWVDMAGAFYFTDLGAKLGI
jgi:hypothetical protein